MATIRVNRTTQADGKRLGCGCSVVTAHHSVIALEGASRRSVDRAGEPNKNDRSINAELVAMLEMALEAEDTDARALFPGPSGSRHSRARTDVNRECRACRMGS
jgi:hypothetical protein